MAEAREWTPGFKIKLIVTFLRVMSFIFDTLLFIFWYVLQDPKRRILKSKGTKAQQITKRDYTAPWRCLESLTELKETPIQGLSTVDEVIARSISLYHDNDCLGRREIQSVEEHTQPDGTCVEKLKLGEYIWCSYGDVLSQMKNIWTGLQALGIQHKQKICIYSETCLEWTVLALTCLRYNITLVAISPAWDESDVIKNIYASEGTYLACSLSLLPVVGNVVRRLPEITHLILFDSMKSKNKLPEDLPNALHVHTLSGLQDGSTTLGHTGEHGFTKPTKDDIACILFSRGNVGTSKGVLISHGNLMAALSGWNELEITDKDTYIGYLPMCQIFEFIMELCMITHGARIGLSSPDTLTNTCSLIKQGEQGDLPTLHPTIMMCNDLSLEHLYNDILKMVDKYDIFGKAMFQYAYHYKRGQTKRGYQTYMMDRFFFDNFRSIVGNNLRTIYCTAGTVSISLQLYAQVCFDCNVFSGYGRTETCGVGTIQDTTYCLGNNKEYSSSTGWVGHPQHGCEIMLIDWKDGGILTSHKPNPQGEIYVGGPVVAEGYLNHSELATARFVEIRGQRYFITGDIGEVDKDGCFRFLDRKKEIVKRKTYPHNSVYLTRTEAILKMTPMIKDIYLLLSDKKQHLIGVVFPEVEKLRAEILEDDDFPHQIYKDMSLEDMCESEEISQFVLQALKAKTGPHLDRLEDWEVPEFIMLCPKSWWLPKCVFLQFRNKRRKDIVALHGDEISGMLQTLHKQSQISVHCDDEAGSEIWSRGQSPEDSQKMVETMSTGTESTVVTVHG